MLFFIMGRLKSIVLQYIKYNKITSKGVLSILFDYLPLRVKRGILFEEYIDFHLYDAPKDIKDCFLGVKEQWRLLEVLNPRKYFIVARNKYFAHMFLEAVNVPTAELYCYYNPEYNLCDNAYISCRVYDTVRILKEKSVKQCVIKTTEDSHGDNVIVIKNIEYIQNDCLLLCFDGEIIKLSSIMGKKPLIFEKLIKQTSQFSSFNPTSVNTVRFMTTLYPSGEAKIIGAFIKIGREGRCVDNAGNGGNVDACIDVRSGEIVSAYRFENFQNMVSVKCHPDTNTQISGIFIDRWNEICSQIIRFQQAMPFVKAVGWDIAITDYGPVVIEFNDFWDRTGQIFIGKGWRKEIVDCYNAWINKQ